MALYPTPLAVPSSPGPDASECSSKDKMAYVPIVGNPLHSYLPSTTTSAVMDMARPLSRHSGPRPSPATDATTITAITTTAAMATIVRGMLEEFRNDMDIVTLECTYLSGPQLHRHPSVLLRSYHFEKLLLLFYYLWTMSRQIGHSREPVAPVFLVGRIRPSPLENAFGMN